MLVKAVRRGLSTPLLVGDLPFGSYEVSNEQAVTTAQRFMKEGGCDAIKLEGGGVMVERARAIAATGIPVVGHVGLTPQTATALGGFKAQARTAERAQRMIEDALALQEAGCCLIVFEAIPAAVAEVAMEQPEVPVIGIGAGPGTDGQVLVWHDLLGLYEWGSPRFVKRYAEIRPQILDALRRYAGEVRTGEFPSAEYTYRSIRRARRAAPAGRLRGTRASRRLTAGRLGAARPARVLHAADHPRRRARCHGVALDVLGDDAVRADHAALADVTPLVTTTFAPSQQFAPIRVGPLLSKPCQVIGFSGSS